MELVDAEVITTRPGRNYVLVRLETDVGLVGWGDATLNGREKAVETALRDHVLPELLGKDPRRIEDVWQSMFRHTYWRGGPVLNTALSGVDVALWDLKGKAAETPVYDLLGGRTREYASVYEHCGGPDAETIVANCESALDHGIEHLRVNPHGESEEYLDLDAVVDVVRRVREELGREPNLLLDVHGRATPVEAARLARRLEDVGLFFLEDPVRPESPNALETVRGSGTPLAVGELATDPWEQLPLVERELIDFVRADVVHVGGITAADKLAAVAELHHVRTAFHGPSDISPIGLAATVHLDLSLANFGVQELPEYARPSYDREELPLWNPEVHDVFSGGATLVDGTGGLDVPDEPGLGVIMDVERAREFEYEPQPLPSPRNPDGSVADW